MDCVSYREAVSARLDGETAPVSAAALDRHVANCTDCAAFAAGAGELDQRVRIREAADIPDLTAAILAATGGRGASQRDERPRQLRLLLG